MTTEDEPLRPDLVIEWPPAGPAFILPHLVSVFEADEQGAERQLTGISRMTLHMSPDDLVTADVETILAGDGEPLGPGEQPAVEDDGLATAVFRYMVAAVRVRDTAQ